jgi:hypothetical protein
MSAGRHRTQRAGLALLAAGACLSAARGGPLADRLCAAYEALDTIQCEIRKTSDSGRHTVRMLSRVTYRRPQRLHVVNAAPVERRILLDGTNLYYHQAGSPKGFSRPIAELTGPWAAAARDIPGTPVEHLLRARPLPETPLPETNGLRRTACRGTNVYVILSTDADARLHRVEIFAAETNTVPLGVYAYENFAPAGDTWIPLLHRGRARLPGGGVMTETRIIDNLLVNAPVDADRFDPARYFTNVTFTATFMDTLGQN